MTWVRLDPPGPADGLVVRGGPWDAARARDALAAVRSGATVLLLPDEAPAGEVARYTALADAEPRGAGVLLATSGSTGAPKLVFRSVRSLADEGRRYLRGGWVTGADRVLLAVSPAHAYGLGWLWGCLLAGAQVAVVAPMAFGAIEAALRDATVLVTTPHLARLLMRRAPAAPALRLAMAGAGPVAAALDAGWAMRVGVGLARNYGSTETGALLAGPAGLPSGCAGRAMPGVRVEVLPGRVRATLEDGSVHDLPDVASVDADGNVTILGRAGGGGGRIGFRWVAPLDVEAAAVALPYVVDAVAVEAGGALRLDYVTAGGAATDPEWVRARVRQSVSAPVTARRVRRIRRTGAGKPAAPPPLPPGPPGSVAAVVAEALAAGGDGEVADDLREVAARAGDAPSPVSAADLVAALRRGYGAGEDLTALPDPFRIERRFLDAAGCDPAEALRWVVAGTGDWWTLDALRAGLAAAGLVVDEVTERGDGVAVVTGHRP